MSVFDEIKDKVEEVVSDCVWNLCDKAEEVLDLADRRMQRRFEKLSEKEEAFNAMFGLEKFKDASIKDRAKVVFTKKEPTKKTFAEYGDIIGVDRGIYQHYGVYIGNNRVIHFAPKNSDSDFDWLNPQNVEIREDDMSKFLGDSNEYFVFDCESKNKHRLKFNTQAFVGNASLFKNFMSLFDSRELLEVYTPKETVQRAKSRLGETGYSLDINNCEHFAIWCKTGIHKSVQVDTVLKVLVKIPIIFVVP
ncbi:lecithin retinol acyltransferase family protein [Clostridium thailandense]|uniref:lecithin retinol acyltransferase family protein n=1 Tax=Clostridium thailandense TaxID=2794346 RepID=UPI0039898C38